MNYLGHAVQPRVGQLDASLLDAELLRQLHEQLVEGSGSLGTAWREELLLALRSLLFGATVWRHGTTYGGQLQNLILLDAKSTNSIRLPLSKLKRLVYGAVTIGGAYWHAKLSSYLVSADDTAPSTRFLRRLLSLAAFGWGAASLASLLAFLYSGRYATLLMRLLRIRWAPAQRESPRAVNYEFQNRQLVWNATTEFLLFVLPLLNISRLQRLVMRHFSGNKSLSSNKQAKSLPDRTCAICYQKEVKNKSVTNPYAGECGHPYCYVCLSLKVSEDPGWPCARCGVPIKTIKRWDPKESETQSEQMLTEY